VDLWFKNVESLPIDAKTANLTWLLHEMEHRTLPNMKHGQGKEKVLLTWDPPSTEAAPAAGAGAGGEAGAPRGNATIRVVSKTTVQHNMPHKAPLTLQVRCRPQATCPCPVTCGSMPSRTCAPPAGCPCAAIGLVMLLG
jgi:hypothetical protein